MRLPAALRPFLTERFLRDGFAISLLWAAAAGAVGALATLAFRAGISGLV